MAAYTNACYKKYVIKADREIDIGTLLTSKDIYMPAKSKKQAAFMGAVAGGKIKVKGLGKNKAKEFLRGVKYKGLPRIKKTK